MRPRAWLRAMRRTVVRSRVRSKRMAGWQSACRRTADPTVLWAVLRKSSSRPEFPHALHELALLHERGIDNVLFVDPKFSCELLALAAELGYAPSAYKLGVNYEYGRMGRPQDAGLSIHANNIAAQQEHKEACFALTAWYLVGAPSVLPQSDAEAYIFGRRRLRSRDWARRNMLSAALLKLVTTAAEHSGYAKLVTLFSDVALTDGHWHCQRSG
ncbi:hypothetical protein V8E36_008800 [Tilletia maclaganii]